MDDKRYWLENLFDLERIAKLIRILPKTVNANVDTSFEHDGKVYFINKTDSDIILKCSDGRELDIKAYSSRVDGDFGGFYDLTRVSCKYRLLDSVIELYKEMDNMTLDEFEEIKMASDGCCLFSHVVNGYVQSFRNFSTNNIDDYKFTKDGIVYHNYLISKDCEKVIDKYGVPIPENLDKFSSFFKKYTDSFLKMLNCDELFYNARDEIIKDFEVENISSHYDEIKTLNDIKLPGLKYAIKFRDAIFDGSIEDYLFSGEELDLFTNELTNKLKSQIDDYDDSELIDEAKKLVKALSEKGIEILKKIIDSVE